MENKLDLFNNFTTGVNGTEVQIDLYEAYREKTGIFMAYKHVPYIIGTIIMITNIIVVISSGLILKKGQQPKSTYLLLGNISLADTIIGFLVIYTKYVQKSITSKIMCAIELGMLVTVAKVSIFSVFLIAVDRYIYILHGLYYQRWFNTTRVKVGILCIWVLSIIIGFMPATGWTNKELNLGRCYYLDLFPGSLLLLNSFLSIVFIVVVAILYSIILVRALKNIKLLNSASKSLDKPTTEKPKLRMCRHTRNSRRSIPICDKKRCTYSISIPPTTRRSDSEVGIMGVNRSASFNNFSSVSTKHKTMPVKAKSSDDLTNAKTNVKHYYYSKSDTQSKTRFESNCSVYSVESNISNRNSSETDVNTVSNELEVSTNHAANRKLKEPNKWRAITVVMLTTGSFMLTWMPFYIGIIAFYFCEDKLTVKCMHIRVLLSGPLSSLAFFNSILNPLIYAWWHKGFKRSIRTYYKKCLLKLMCHFN